MWWSAAVGLRHSVARWLLVWCRICGAGSLEIWNSFVGFDLTGLGSDHLIHDPSVIFLFLDHRWCVETNHHLYYTYIDTLINKSWMRLYIDVLDYPIHAPCSAMILLSRTIPLVKTIGKQKTVNPDKGQETGDGVSTCFIQPQPQTQTLKLQTS